MEDSSLLNQGDYSFGKLFFPHHTFPADGEWVDIECPDGNDRVLRYVSNRKQFIDITWSEKFKVWCGRYIQRNGNIKMEKGISQQWMDMNFSPEFQEDCKSRSQGEKKRVFCRVPVGSVMKSVDCIPDPPPTNPLVPKVTYQQGSRDLCFSASLASAFHHMKLDGLAQEVHAYGMSLIESSEAWKDRPVLVRDYVLKSSLKYRQHFTSVKLFPGQDIFELNTFYQPALIVPRGSDSSVNHAFTILNNWIFDSNNLNGIPLTIRNIEAVLSSGYEGIAAGYLFIAIRQKRQKRKKRGKGRKYGSFKRQKKGDALH